MRATSRTSAPASIACCRSSVTRHAAVTDKFPDRIKAREAELRGIWAGLELRNDRVRAVTGVKFRTLDESMRDCVESLLTIASVKPKRRPGFE